MTATSGITVIDADTASKIAELTSAGNVAADRSNQDSGIAVIKAEPCINIENSSNELLLISTEPKNSVTAQVLTQDGSSGKTVNISGVMEGERTGVSGSFGDKSIDADALREMVTVTNDNNEVSFISVDLIQPQQANARL